MLSKGKVRPCSKAKRRAQTALRAVGDPGVISIMTILLNPGCTQSHRNIKHAECWAPLEILKRGGWREAWTVACG